MRVKARDWLALTSEEKRRMLLLLVGMSHMGRTVYVPMSGVQNIYLQIQN